MPITVSCPCGKRFKTADANAGKKAKCAGCGSILEIPRPVPQRAAEPEADGLFGLAESTEVFAPAPTAAPAARPVARASSTLASIAPPLGKRDRDPGPQRIPVITLSPGIIILIIAAIMIPAALLLVREGPIKAQKQWAALNTQAADNISGQTVRAIEVQYKAMGIDDSDPDNATPHPKVTNFFFDEPVLMWTLPESITFQGRTNEGTLRGTFHPHTLKYEADVQIEGATHRVTGSVDPTLNEFDFDGHPAKG